MDAHLCGAVDFHQLHPAKWQSRDVWLLVTSVLHTPVNRGYKRSRKHSPVAEGKNDKRYLGGPTNNTCRYEIWIPLACVIPLTHVFWCLVILSSAPEHHQRAPRRRQRGGSLQPVQHHQGGALQHTHKFPLFDIRKRRSVSQSLPSCDSADPEGGE